MLENVCRTRRHTTFYYSAGPADGTPVIFVHGWPELAYSWRHQLPVFGALGFRAIAPDMRGYGRSSIPARHEDYALELAVADMLELLDHLGAEKAVWIGHDWGAPVVWSLAQHHAARCHAVANLCAPYMPAGFGRESSLPHVRREIYPEDRFPAGQWEYFLFHRDHFDECVAAFEANVRNAVRTLFRAGDPAHMEKPSPTAFTRLRGGFFGPGSAPAPPLPRDPAVLTEEDEHRYAAALERGGFSGPNSWYVNEDANLAYARRAPGGARLAMPVLFLHAAYDAVCDTAASTMAQPMRDHCARLTEVTVKSGHWMAQEKPQEVNAALARWLAAAVPAAWRA